MVVRQLCHTEYGVSSADDDYDDDSDFNEHPYYSLLADKKSARFEKQ